MNRREFSALIAAGFLFPQKLWGSLTSQEKQAAASLADLGDDIHWQYYPIYYMRLGGREVYQLWQPGIVMAVVGRAEEVRTYSEIQPTRKTIGVFNAIKDAPSQSWIVDEGCGIPYLPCGDDKSRVIRLLADLNYSPLILHIGNAENLVAQGHLIRMKPYRTFDKYRGRNEIMEEVRNELPRA